MRRILFISDTQIPYHNPNQVRAVIRFAGLWQPDEIIQVGDLMDFPQPSTWSKATAEEFKGSVFADAEVGKQFLETLRGVYHGPIKVLEGNHDSRPRTYLARYAPALAESRAFHLDTMLDFKRYGVELVESFHSFAPGWVAVHGHEGFTLSQIAGRTAMMAAKKVGASVVMGHTHRAGIQSETTGRPGTYSTLTGVEVGHLMDVRPGKTPAYLKGGFANWQSAFATAFIHDQLVSVNIHPITHDGSFIFEGVSYTPDGKQLL